MGRKRFGVMMMVPVLMLNVTSVSAQTTEYEYDVLNRLTEVNDEENGTTNFRYDSAGNLLSVDSVDLQNTLSDEENFMTKGVQEGWTPYATKGVTVDYSLKTEGINQPKMDIETQVDLELEENEELELIEKTEVEEGSESTDVVDGNAENGNPENDSADLEKEEEVSETPASEEQFEANEETDIIHEEIKDSMAQPNIMQQISAVMDRPGGANIYKDFQVMQNKSYTIKGRVKAEQLQNTAVQVIVNYYNKNDEFIGHENIMNILQSSDWTSIESSVTLPIDAAKARLHLQILSPQAEGAGVALFSEFSLLEKDFLVE